MSEQLAKSQPPPLLFGIITPEMLQDIDVQKMGQLLDMKIRVDSIEAEKQLATALAAFQRNAPVIRKERKSNNSEYASLDDIMIAIRESLSSNGLSVSFDTRTEEKQLTAICHILHGGGAKFSREVTVPIDTGMRGSNVSQQAGSASSYARRYALVAALNLIVSDHDDDGQSAGANAINETEIAEIWALLEKFANPEMVRDGMLTWLRLESVDQIPLARYEEVKSKLRAKLAEKGESK